MSTILTSKDSQKITDLIASGIENEEYYINICNSLVSEYAAGLDELMNKFYNDCVVSEASDQELEKYLFELNTNVYFLSAKLESTGIKQDLSKIAMKESYNLEYLDAKFKAETAKIKTTVAELSSIAEEKSKYDTVLNSLYSRVYSTIKSKIDACYDTISSIRKIISKRMQDVALNKIN